MGFLKLFRKSKVEKEVEKRKIEFKEIEKFIEEETKEKKLKLEENVKQFRKNFISYFKILAKDFDELAHSNFERLILEDRRDLSNIIETSRRNYCNKSRDLISKLIWYLEKESLAIEIEAAILKTFNRLNSFSREMEILTIPFKKQIKKISNDLKIIKNEIENFENFLNSDYKILEKEKKAKEIIEKIKKIRSEKRKKEIEKIEIEKEIKKLKDLIKTLKVVVDKARNSEEFKVLKSLKDEKLNLELEKKEIILMVDNLISSVSRQVRIYLHKNKVDKLEKARVISILENPERIFKGDLHIFEKILGNTGKNIEKIEKDKKKRNKFLLLEKKIGNELGKGIIRYRNILKRIEELERKIKMLEAKVDTKKQEEEIKKIEDKIEQLEKAKDEIEKDLNYDENELLIELEELILEILGKKIKINYA
jgi:hypothetical protein